MLGRVLFGATTVGGGLTAMRTGIFGRNEVKYINDSPTIVDEGKQYELESHEKYTLYDEVHVKTTTFKNRYPYPGNPNQVETTFSNWDRTQYMPSFDNIYFRPADVMVYPHQGAFVSHVSHGWDYRVIIEQAKEKIDNFLN